MRPPFHPNPDAHRCLHAALRMAVEGARPGVSVPFPLLDSLTGRQPGEGTWTHGAYLAVAHLQVEARAWDAFDYAAFARDPRGTVRRDLPLALAMRMLQGSDLQAAADLAKVLLSIRPLPIEPRSPDLHDVDELLDAGWLLIANVDLCRLDDVPGISGHSLLLFDRDEEAYVAHDPGTSGAGHPDRRIPRDAFLHAWSYMGDGLRELLGVRGRPG